MDSDFHRNYLGFSVPDCDKSILKQTDGKFRVNIFKEFNYAHHDRYPPLYTMYEEPRHGLPSAYMIYMLADSEYEAAMKLVGSWAHWQRLLKCNEFLYGSKDGRHNWFGIESWREEREIRERSQALNQLRIAAAGGNVQAQKILLDGEKPTSKKSKAALKQEKEAAKQAESDVKNDFQRVLSVIQGGKQAANS